MSNTVNSQTYSTFTSKEKRIETTVELQGGRRLSLVTRDSFDGTLVTNASVGIVKDGFVMFRYGGGDYNRVFARNKVRKTKAAVEAQHNKYLADLDQIATEASGFYGVTIVKA